MYVRIIHIFDQNILIKQNIFATLLSKWEFFQFVEPQKAMTDGDIIQTIALRQTRFPLHFAYRI